MYNREKQQMANNNNNNNNLSDFINSCVKKKEKNRTL